MQGTVIFNQRGADCGQLPRRFQQICQYFNSCPHDEQPLEFNQDTQETASISFSETKYWFYGAIAQLRKSTQDERGQINLISLHLNFTIDV